jgi:hypothetical protein|tara:strand:- start:359 stop:586 length:228 start_codon:yes stop_codon:yes gene_type:complete
MAKKTKGKRKNLLKTDPIPANNLSYEDKVNINATVVTPVEKVEEKKVEEDVPVKTYATGRPMTAFNTRVRTDQTN